MTDSKYGLHINNWTEDADKFAECQPAVMKSIDHNPDRLARFRAISPGTLWIGRVYLDNEAFESPLADARRVAGAILKGLRGCRYDVLEGINEPDIGEDIERAKHLCEFNIELARLLHGGGFQYAAYSFAATRPHLALWPYLEPALLESDYLAMHAYGPGPLYHEPYWYAFAYRLSWKALKPPNNMWPNMPNLRGILLTEYGIARGLKWTDKDVGWKANEGPQVTPEGYLNELIVADGEFDPYIKGATIFQTGDTSGKWQTFEIKELLPAIRQHIVAYRRTKEPGPPKKEEPKMEQPIRVLMPDKSVKTMELEEYLKGVIGLEIGSQSPPEALKAQAVAARCYALNAIKNPRHKPSADICTTTHCQVWGGDTAHSIATDNAVEATRGIVARYGAAPPYLGGVINAFYFGHCDGHTRNPTKAYPTPWLVDLPYLRPVDCPCGYTSMYGHGVGMCQRGAIKMAEEGATYKEILWHYYSGVEIGGEKEPPKEDWLQVIDSATDAIKNAVAKMRKSQK